MAETREKETDDLHTPGALTRLLLVDDLTLEYLTIKAEVQNKTPGEVLGLLIREKLMELARTCSGL